MKGQTRSRSGSGFRLAFLCLYLFPSIASAGVIVVTTFIQAAVDEAKPGDTIIVPPGTYPESVRVDKSNITIRGSHAAVIDATGFINGIRVGTGTGDTHVLECPPLTVKNFTLIGLTIQNADEDGVLLTGVNGYHLVGGKYRGDGRYGIFPFCSRNGQIRLNHVKGGPDKCRDTGIYVGNSARATITTNRATQCTVGIQIANSSDIVIKGNRVSNNTLGILTIVDPNNPIPKTENVLIENNIVRRNNFPNHGDEPELQQIPVGTGVLNVGSDNVHIKRNKIVGNDTFGLVVTQNPRAKEDKRIEPNPDKNEVRRNVILANGKNPAVGVPTPGVDIFYDGTGSKNCFAENIFQTEFPEGITENFPCP